MSSLDYLLALLVAAVSIGRVRFLGLGAKAGARAYNGCLMALSTVESRGREGQHPHEAERNLAIT